MSEIKTNKISPRKDTTTTIGDSGDSVTISSGTTTTNAGTINTAGITGGTINNTTGTINLSGVIDWEPTPQSGDFRAVANKGYFIDTSSGARQITMPDSPSAGDVVAFKDYANTFDTNRLTIKNGGDKIQGSDSDFENTTKGASLEFIYVNATKGWLLIDFAKANDILESPAFTIATGGTITTCGNFKIHTFTGPGTFCVSQIGNNSPTIPAGGPAVVDYLVVAGGGSGGIGDDDEGSGAGGGAGGMRESHSTPVSGCYTASPLATPTGVTITKTGFPITVGAGGTAAPFYTPVIGSDSIFSNITSTGGGGGCRSHPGSLPGDRINGGSGGGGFRSMCGQPAGLGNTPPVSPPQGNPGGSGGTCYRATGGGGGGATAAGGAQTNSGSDNNPRPGNSGGAGATTGITGSAVAYAGGGSSGSSHNNTTKAGGTGGGGAGGASCGAVQPVGGISGSNGTANTGGGGGGGANGGGAADAITPGVGGLSGAGGSGIVIIRYKYQ